MAALVPTQAPPQAPATPTTPKIQLATKQQLLATGVGGLATPASLAGTPASLAPPQDSPEYLQIQIATKNLVIQRLNAEVASLKRQLEVALRDLALARATAAPPSAAEPPAKKKKTAAPAPPTATEGGSALVSVTSPELLARSLAALEARPAASAQRLRSALKSSLSAQMVYKPAHRWRASRVSAEIPNLAFDDVKAILGDELFAKGARGPVRYTLDATLPDLEVAGLAVTKSLRFGSVLALGNGLKFTYSTNTKVLKATGDCVMLR